jgi:hypothetical protein
MIVKCNCPDVGPAAVYQTERYGQGKRVGNLTGDNKSIRCSVCGKTHSSF